MKEWKIKEIFVIIRIVDAYAFTKNGKRKNTQYAQDMPKYAKHPKCSTHNNI